MAKKKVTVQAVLNVSNLDKFAVAYEVALTETMKPGSGFSYNPKLTPASLTALMVVALKGGVPLILGVASIDACKALKIKPTWPALSKFLHEA